MTIVINGIECKDVPIHAGELEVDKIGKETKYTDKDGKLVKKIQIQGSEYKWVFEDGTEYTGKAYKNFKGKPISEFSKTTLIEKYDISDKKDMKYFINNELTYLMINKKLKDWVKGLDSEGKFVTFKFTNRGLKIYKAGLVYDTDLDKVFMRLFRGDLRKANLTEKEDVKEIEVEEKVAKLDLDNLEV